VLGQTHGGSFSAQVNARVAAEWKRQNLQAVVFVQDRKTKQIFGAASAKV